MIWLRQLWLRFQTLFRRDRVAGRLDDELRFHLDQQIAENVAAGMQPEEARRAARLVFGNPAVFRETTRDTWGWTWLETLLQDVRYAGRSLRKSPGFTGIAVLTLTLGIGANTAIFSVVNTVLLRPLPFPHSSQLVDLWAHSSLFDFPHLGLSLADIDDIRTESTVFSGIAPYKFSGKTMTGRGAPHRLDGAEISAEFFSTLGIRPLYGRSFTPAEMQPGQDREIILSYSLWKEQFGGDSRVIGQTVRLDKKPYTIIGVMPSRQHLDYVTDDQFWTPLAPTNDERAARQNHGTDAIARLKPGRTIQQAQAQLDAIAARLAKTYPDADKGWSFRVVSLESDVVGDARPPLLILLGAVGFVLLIACANVGNLFLSRGWARRRELAIRSALGATRARITRHLLVEGFIVALVGGIFGLLVAVWGVQGLRSLLPPETPRIKDLSIDQTVLWFTLGVSILSGILFALAPAALASRQDLNAIVKEGGAQTGAGSQHKLLRQLLVVGEVAVALVLVIGATLALRSFARLLTVNMGFRSDNLLTMTLTFPTGKFTKPGESVPYVRQILDLTKASPGVEGASASLYAPLSDMKGESTVHTDAMPPDGPAAMTQANRAAPGYFQTLGIPLLAGRDFTDADASAAPDVYIVNQAFAGKFFGTASPIGRRIWTNADANHKPKWGRIIGEIANTRDEGAKEAPAPEIFAAYYQVEDSGGISLIVRTKADPLATVSAIEERIWSIENAQSLEDVRTMDQLMAHSNAAPRFETFLLSIFGGLGLLLAIVGIYGVISYSVGQRTHEIGIRIALGADPLRVMRLVLAQGLNLALAGVLIGIAASFALTRFMSSLLFGVSATDPLTFASVAFGLIAVSLAACYIPARRAMRVDPMVALRHE
ncbi:MAG TPA: ABC transporter permease [Candidatus Acidoferrales bacterium]|nr:ABC transporter permease [Candidatus Acidoferrales bacterium]